MSHESSSLWHIVIPFYPSQSPILPHLDGHLFLSDLIFEKGLFILICSFLLWPISISSISKHLFVIRIVNFIFVFIDCSLFSLPHSPSSPHHHTDLHQRSGVHLKWNSGAKFYESNSCCLPAWLVMLLYKCDSLFVCIK